MVLGLFVRAILLKAGYNQNTNMKLHCKLSKERKARESQGPTVVKQLLFIQTFYFGYGSHAVQNTIFSELRMTNSASITFINFSLVITEFHDLGLQPFSSTFYLCMLQDVLMIFLYLRSSSVWLESYSKGCTQFFQKCGLPMFVPLSPKSKMYLLRNHRA